MRKEMYTISSHLRKYLYLLLGTPRLGMDGNDRRAGSLRCLRLREAIWRSDDCPLCLMWWKTVSLSLARSPLKNGFQNPIPCDRMSSAVLCGECLE